MPETVRAALLDDHLDLATGPRLLCSPAGSSPRSNRPVSPMLRAPVKGPRERSCSMAAQAAVCFRPFHIGKQANPANISAVS